MQNDPVNFVDPTGLLPAQCNGSEVTDPATGQSTCIPIISGGTVTVNSGPDPTMYRFVLNSFFGGFSGGSNDGGLGSTLASSAFRPFDIPTITAIVDIYLAQEACIDFASRILNAVSTGDNKVLNGGNLQELFKVFLAQSNGGYTRSKPPGSAGFGSPTGLINKGNGKIFSPEFKSMSSFGQAMYDAQTTVAELFHMAGKKEYYTDRALAEAVHSIPEYAALYRPGITPSVFSPRYPHKKDAEKNPNHGGWSSYFHNVQRQICAP